MKRLPSLKQLEYLTSLSEYEHFGKASEHCNVTPSTLSAGIRDLEETLGVSVAERTKRSVFITPIGQEIAKRANSLLRDAEDIMALASSQTEPLTTSISLGAIPTISPFVLPKVYSLLENQYPKLSLYLREEQTDKLLSRLQSGDIDVALLALPYELENLTTSVLFDDAFVFACSTDHPFAKKKSISNQDLDDQPLLLLEEGHCLRTHALDACKLADTPMRTSFEATSLQTLIQMVASGLGVTLLPKMSTESTNLLTEHIRLIPIEPTMSRQIGLVWRQSSPRQIEFEMLADVFRPKD